VDGGIVQFRVRQIKLRPCVQQHSVQFRVFNVLKEERKEKFEKKKMGSETLKH
jgi:hypothetical protein